MRWFIVCLFIIGLAGCGGGGGPSASPSIPSCPPSSSSATNVISVCVDSGPLTTQREVNRLYTDITICEPGTSNCQTIDHVLVDTGSVGLRLLRDQMTVTSTNTSYFNCARFLDLSYAWGSVVKLDLKLGSQTISALPVQLLGDSAAACASGAYSPINSVQDLGAKGILGIGLFEQDCGSACVTGLTGQYYSCPSGGTCTGTTAPLIEQLQNPIAMRSTDNNGFVIDLPAVSASGASSLKGDLIFGIGTQANNSMSGATVLPTNALGYVKTELAGATYLESFIDTGSNGIYFDTLLSTCFSGNFYCPSGSTPFTANMTGDGGSPTIPINFVVDNTRTLFDLGYTVLPTLAGPIGDGDIFDWGLPFYYGRKVFQGLSGKTTTTSGPSYTGPFIAF